MPLGCLGTLAELVVRLRKHKEILWVEARIDLLCRLKVSNSLFERSFRWRGEERSGSALLDIRRPPPPPLALLQPTRDTAPRRFARDPAMGFAGAYRKSRSRSVLALTTATTR